MKIVFLNSAKSGKVIEVPEVGLCFGREADNDVILSDDAKVSRYHAKLSLTDGIWQIYDLDSMNGVKLNGTTIKKSALLSVQDEIQIGDFRFLFTDNEADAAAAGAAESKPGLTPQDSEKKVEKEQKSPTVRRRVLALLAGLLLVLILALAAVFLPNNKKDNVLPKKAPKSNALQVYYEKLSAAPQAVFRYELRIKDKKLRVTVDDLKNRRQLSETRPLSADQLKTLKAAILTPAFLALRSRRSQNDTNRLERTTLMIQSGRTGNAVEIVNELRPPALTQATDKLEALAEDAFGFVAVPLSREAVMTRVRERFDFAERAFAEREVEPQNLYRSREAYRYVVEYLKGYNDKPDFYRKAAAKLKKTSEMLEKQLKTHVFNGRVHMKLGELERARAELQEILDKVPDPRNEYVQQARKLLFDISRRQEQIKRNRRKKHKL